MIPERTLSVVLDDCLGIIRGEEVVILVDRDTDGVVIEAICAGIEGRGAVPVISTMPRYEIPGSEPPGAIARILSGSTAAIELTSTFVGSSRARQDATATGTRYLCMPGVVADTFRAGGPLDVDFPALRRTTETVAEAWSAADSYRLTTPAGTDLSGSIRGRRGRALYGVAREPGAYMCPPDVEAGTAPVEGSSNGVVVIDGDFLFMGDGPVSEPVTLRVGDGRLTGWDGAESERLTDMIDRCRDARMSNLAEVSLGLNPRGTICAVPMETESTLGSAHIAFGNSIAYGGTVAAVAHLDCVMRDATLELDGRPVIVGGRLAADL